jgi:anti-sigma B factor antagonist
MMPAQPRRRRLETEEIGDVTVAAFTDKKILEAEHIQTLGDQLASLLDDAGRKKLVLNFSRVEFMSSAALGMLATLHRKARAAGAKLVLCAIDDNIREVFTITKLDKQFLICRDEQEALQKMQ